MYMYIHYNHSVSMKIKLKEKSHFWKIFVILYRVMNREMPKNTLLVIFRNPFELSKVYFGHFHVIWSEVDQIKCSVNSIWT